MLITTFQSGNIFTRSMEPGYSVLPCLEDITTTMSIMAIRWSSMNLHPTSKRIIIESSMVVIKGEGTRR